MFKVDRQTTQDNFPTSRVHTNGNNIIVLFSRKFCIFQVKQDIDKS